MENIAVSQTVYHWLITPSIGFYKWSPTHTVYHWLITSLVGLYTLSSLLCHSISVAYNTIKRILQIESNIPLLYQKLYITCLLHH